MSRNHEIKASSRRIATILGVLGILTSLAFSSCENPLVEAAKTIQSTTASPILAMTSAMGTAVQVGATLMFPATSVGGSSTLVLTITNSGKSALSITPPSITITMGTDIETESFTLETPPAETIEPSKSTSLTMGFYPITAGTKTATITIKTNDLMTPEFSFSFSGVGLSTDKDLTTFSIANPVAIGVFSTNGIDILLPSGTPATNLVAVFTTSASATVTVTGVAQTSNVTANNFTNPVVYKVSAEDGTFRTYNVTVIFYNTVPVLATMVAPLDIRTASATGQGNIQNNGGATVTVSGLCWSTSQNPTIDSSKTTNSSASGSFSSEINPLSPGTTYYVRPYATNSIGTGYGQQVQFTTLPDAPASPTVAAVPGPSGSGQLAVSWPPVTGATLYEVYCSTSNSLPANTASGGTDIVGTSCTLVGLTNYSNYYVWVKAKSASGFGGVSVVSAPTMVGIKVASISLNKTAATFLPGSSETVTVTYTPTTATQPSVTWSTSASTFATVSDAIITGGSAAGSATVTATAVDGGGATKSFTATNKLFAANTVGPAGGVLFYDSGSYGTKGWRYMEAATANVTGTWNNGSSIGIPGAKGADYGNGRTNTDAIVVSQGAGNYMAILCKNYLQGEYADWFMPSKNEADKLITVYPACKTGVGSFYSSTQIEYNSCWAYNVDNSDWRVSVVYMSFATRPIRQF